MIETHRGIRTTTKKINELKPKTITNRLGQLSISLPRIDDKKRWAGYPGIAGIARQTARLIPKNIHFYLEPFAGTAKVYQEYRKLEPDSVYFLIDKSKFIYRWLRENFKRFSDTLILNCDFIEAFEIDFDMKETFYLIDMPWIKSYYDQSFSCFNRKSVKEYDQEIIQICKKLKHAKFIITTRKENKTMLESGFNNYLIQSEYVVSGKYPKVLLTTNLNLDRRKGVTKVR